MENLKKNKNIYIVSDLIFIIWWIGYLTKSSSYIINYYFLGILAIFSLYKTYKTTLNRQEKVITIIFSLIFSFFTSISNYDISSQIVNNYEFYFSNKQLIEIFLLIMLFISGLIVCYYILKLILSYAPTVDKYIFNKNVSSYKKIFFLTFFVLSVIDLTVLFSSQYPGEITTDSINQFTQIITRSYSNHHPFWHTQIINVFYTIGFNIFGNINNAVALYSVVQILIVNLIISFSNMTLSQLKVNKLINIFYCLFFAIIPFNILYSFTIWKDILFTSSILLMLTCLVRTLTNIGNKTINYSLLSLGCLGFGVLRSNGWYALLLSTIIYTIIFSKKKKIIPILLIIILSITYFMNNQLLNILYVKKTEMVESLSIPIQQISRVVYDGCELNQEETKLIDNILETNIIAELYKPYTSDPIKFEINTKDKEAYIKNHYSDYINLYIKLAFKYPSEYLKAWVDQTKGYYNSGYDYTIEVQGVKENSIGIDRPGKYYNNFNLFINNYRVLFRKLPILNPIVSIGNYVFIVFICLYLALIYKNINISSLCIPLIALLLTLLIATPVFAEFRYAYPIIISSSFIVICSLFFIKNEN